MDPAVSDILRLIKIDDNQTDENAKPTFTDSESHGTSRKQKDSSDGLYYNTSLAYAQEEKILGTMRYTKNRDIRLNYIKRRKRENITRLQRRKEECI